MENVNYLLPVFSELLLSGMCFKLSLKQESLSQEELDLVMNSNFGGDFGDQNLIDGILDDLGDHFFDFGDQNLIAGIQDDLGDHFFEALDTIETFVNNLEPEISFGNLQQIAHALMLLFPFCILLHFASFCILHFAS